MKSQNINPSPAALATDLKLSLPSPLHEFQPNWNNPNHCQLYIKRDDLIHGIISGNKWRKLSHQLAHVVSQGYRGIVSFGGMHSNHLHALSYCCYKLGIPLTAIVRGHSSAPSTPTMDDMRQWNTQIELVDRLTYKMRSNHEYCRELLQKFPDHHLIPEGGSHELAIDGVSEIMDEIIIGLSHTPDYVICPVGSGGTLAGLVSSNTSTHCLGIAVLKGEGYLEEAVSTLLTKNSCNSEWLINHDYHFGGYGKRPNELQTFCDDSLSSLNLRIEPTYSGKLFYATRELLGQGYFKANSRIVLLHTGGLQGAR